MNDFKGTIIEESLGDVSVLKDISIVSTEIEEITDEHKTPWISQWTLHTVVIPKDQVEKISKRISRALDSKHNWYADFKNETYHYIIFKNKIFLVNRSSKEEYEEATKYGMSLGIPAYQLDFSPDIRE